MPKILITGNGFDLNIGLPTSYNDFITILNYTKNSDDLGFEKVFENSTNYDEILKNFKSFKINQDKIKDLIKKLDCNIWFNFFQNEYQIDSWIDFENRIEYVLKILFTSLDYINENVFSLGPLNDQSLTWKPEIFNNNVELIEVLQKFSIIDSDEKYYITFNKDYLVSRYNFYSDLDLEKITRFLYQELVDFKKIFNYYFEIFVFPFYDNIKARLDKNLFSMINYHYTFNYTPTFEKIFKKRKETRFLHGKINSAINQIVIGINEIPSEKVDKKYFLPFTKYFQKLNNDTDYIFIKELKKNSSTNFMFFFYGHSLDKADEDYINEVFDFTNELKSKIKKIIVIYHDKKSKSNLLINLLNIRGKHDIQELMRNDILNFLHIESEDLQKELKRSITTTTMNSSVF